MNAVVIREVETKFLFIVDEDFWYDCLEPFQRGIITPATEVKFNIPHDNFTFSFQANGTGGPDDWGNLVAIKGRRRFERAGSR